MNDDDLRREIRRQTRSLRGYALLMTLSACVFALSAFRAQPSQRTRFDEIDVERINIVEPDGKLR